VQRHPGHDQRFWLTCAEIRRVIKRGGIAVIGVPSYMGGGNVAKQLPRPLAWLVNRRPGWRDATPTFKPHYGPEDYYRFSETACREVIMEGFRDVKTLSIMIPPRTICWGVRAH
jgi:hypothetical protein